jgi:hypothetical protein
VGAIIFAASQLLFFFTLGRRRVPLPFWFLLAAVMIFSFPQWLDVLMLNPQSSWIESQHRSLLRTLMLAGEWGICLAPFFAFWPFARIPRRLRPLAGLGMFLGAANFTYYSALLSAMRIAGVPDLFARWGRTILEVRAFTVAGVLVAILALLFREHRQVTEERATLAGELRAAGEIQTMLAPQTIDCLPGLLIDVAFHPMREVGGDFYICRTLPGNRQRLLIGDVSGKGAAAAMTAAVLIGAAELHDSDSPCQLLRHLNLVLRRKHLGGFVTCICADVAEDGIVTVANAGHLSPYHSGREVTVLSGLPLGLNDGGESEYAESCIQLLDGDRLTLFSDGVVEARNETDELFGFEQAASISIRPAHEIAEAAKAFGQEDDITVLTLTFAPVGVAHA